ncbi:MAG: hypothetical protein JSS20_13560 [Proteobacteria bacterium]|nr:hypothetical protein [Pseudomonadota bacterium]
MNVLFQLLSRLSARLLGPVASAARPVLDADALLAMPPKEQGNELQITYNLNARGPSPKRPGMIPSEQN